MAYDPPDSRGVFPNATAGAGSGLSWQTIRPRLGLLGLTNPSVALDEFHTVRVLNQPLPTGTSGGSGGGGGANQADGGKHQLTVDSGKKLSVGLEVLIGLLGFFALCFILFGARWAMHKRRLTQLRKERQLAHTRTDSEDSSKDEYIMQQQVAMSLVRKSTLSSRYGPPSDDTLRKDYARKDSSHSRGELQSYSSYTDDTARTRVSEQLDDENSKEVEDGHERNDEEESGMQGLSDRELGYRQSGVRTSSRALPQSGDEVRRPRSDDPTNTWTDAGATLVDTRPPRFPHTSGDPPSNQLADPALMNDDEHIDRGGFRNEYPPDSPQQRHMRMPSTEAASVAVPLLAHTRGDSRDSVTQGPAQRTPLGVGRPQSRARVGSIGSSSSRQRALSSAEVSPTERASYFDEHGRRPSGPVARDSMVGVGTFNARLSSLGSQPPSSPSQAHPHSPHLSSPLLSHRSLSSTNGVSQVSLSAETTNGHSTTS